MDGRAELPILPGPQFDRIQTLCSNLVTRMVDHHTGVKQEDLDWLAATRKDYRDIRSFHAKNRREGKLPKKRLRELAGKGLTLDNVPEDEAFIMAELSDALYSTFVSIDQTDPKKKRDGTANESMAYLQAATRSNIEFADFFIKVHQRFNLKDEEILRLFDLIFSKSGLNHELNIRGLDQFPGGIIAVVKAYLHLKSQLPNYLFTVPDVNLDMNHSVDLIAQSLDKNETRYYEIKGRKDTHDIEVTEITDEKLMEELRTRIIFNTPDRRDCDTKLRSLYKLYDFVRTQLEKGLKIRAFWIEAPSVF